MYRPTVHHAYRPSDAAIASLNETHLLATDGAKGIRDFAGIPVAARRYAAGRIAVNSTAFTP